MAEVVELSTTTKDGPGLNAGGSRKFSDGTRKYLPHLSLSYVIVVVCCFSLY